MLETKGLTKTYKNGNKQVFALKDVSLFFEKGKIYGIVGQNGAGKTTLIKLLCGLVFPTKGEVFIDGTPLYPRNFQLLYKIGAILEGSRNILWNLTPLQNVKYFSLLRGLNFSVVQKMAEEYFTLFELADKINTPVRNLSQGMKQKTAIVISLLHNPPILLLDEPTLGLDPHSSNSMQKIIKDVAKKEGKIVIITSHQLSIIEKLCDKLVFLSQGQVEYFGDINAYLSRRKKERYLLEIASDKLSLLKEMAIIINEVVVNDGRCLVEVDIDENELTPFITLLVSKRISLYRIEKRTPSLEEIFLKGLKP